LFDTFTENVMLTFMSVCTSVSIPKQVFRDQYKVKPHRRRSFDATDSCALSQVSFTCNFYCFIIIIFFGNLDNYFFF